MRAVDGRGGLVRGWVPTVVGLLVVALAVVAGLELRSWLGARALGPDASGSDLRAAFSRCERPSSDRGAPAPEALAAPHEWLRVVEVVEATRSPDGERSTFPAIVTGTAPGEDAARPQVVEVHTTFWPGIDWGLAHGGTVWLALDASADRADAYLDFVLVTTVAGESFFPGGCLEAELGPLRDELGSEADAVLAALPTSTVEQNRRALGLDR